MRSCRTMLATSAISDVQMQAIPPITLPATKWEPVPPESRMIVHAHARTAKNDTIASNSSSCW